VVNIKPALSSLRRGLKAHMAADVAALSRNDIVTAIGALTRIGKPGAAADLRRHTRTFCEWAVAELAIGHQRADLVARYNKDTAWRERVAAFEKVSAHISALLVEATDARDNVIVMPGVKKGSAE
jgi:hypothetical protein